MQVRLLNFTPNPELTCAAAARLCYSKVSAAEIMQEMSEDRVRRLLEMVIASGHHSTIEHASFTFAIDGISRACSHQLVRHRIGISFDQQSQRYVDMSQPEYVIPPTIAANGDLAARFQEGMEASFALYRELVEAGIPKEDARFVLPNATATRLVMTVNFRQLMHMASIRLCFRAQWEIRRLVQLAKREVERVSPYLASKLLVKCLGQGYCDEFEQCEELAGVIPKKAEVLREFQTKLQEAKGIAP